MDNVKEDYIPMSGFSDKTGLAVSFDELTEQN
jgi:hypothetical protein